MKKTIKKHVLVVMALLALTTTSNAASWRIHSDVNKKANFLDINAAMASSDVQPGDTLYLDPGCALLNNQEITKRVTVIGTGYFRSDTPHAFATLSGYLTIKADYTKIEGLIMNDKEIKVNAKYVVIERCLLFHVNMCSDNSGYFNAMGSVVRQCFIRQGIMGINDSRNPYSHFVTIENCIFAQGFSYISGFVSPTIRNNIIYQTWSVNGNTGNYVMEYISNGIIQNNIIINTFDPTRTFKNISNSTIVTNNVIVGPAENYPAYAAANKFVENSGIVTKEGSASREQFYLLTEDSHAKGYGILDGVAVDCGPFGGPNPYVLNGLPAGIPYYTKAFVDSRSKNGKINVSLNLKMQDE